MKTRVIALALAMSASSVGAALAATCGPIQVCAETTSSFAGTVISEGLSGSETTVRLAWDVTSEGDIRGYRIGRYDCANAAACMTWTHLVMATGSCGEGRSYEVVDGASGPVGRWHYRLEVWGSDGRLACAAEATPR